MGKKYFLGVVGFGFSFFNILIYIFLRYSNYYNTFIPALSFNYYIDDSLRLFYILFGIGFIFSSLGILTIYFEYRKEFSLFLFQFCLILISCLIIYYPKLIYFNPTSYDFLDYRLNFISNLILSTFFTIYGINLLLHRDLGEHKKFTKIIGTFTLIFSLISIPISIYYYFIIMNFESTNLFSLQVSLFSAVVVYILFIGDGWWYMGLVHSVIYFTYYISSFNFSYLPLIFTSFLTWIPFLCCLVLMGLDMSSRFKIGSLNLKDGIKTFRENFNKNQERIRRLNNEKREQRLEALKNKKLKEGELLKEAKSKIELEIKKYSQDFMISIYQLSSKLGYKPNYIRSVVGKLIKEDSRFKKFGFFLYFTEKTTPMKPSPILRKESVIQSTINKKGMDWGCPYCNAPLNKEQGEKMLHNEIVICEYCGHILNKAN